MVSHFRPARCLSQCWLSSPNLVPPWLVIFGLQGVSVKANFHCLLVDTMASHIRPIGCLSQNWLSSPPQVPPWEAIFGLQGVSVKADFHCLLWWPHDKPFSAYRVSQSKLTFIASSGTHMAIHIRPTGCLSQSWLSSPPLVPPWEATFGLQGVSVKADFHRLLWYLHG